MLELCDSLVACVVLLLWSVLFLFILCLIKGLILQQFSLSSDWLSSRSVSLLSLLSELSEGSGSVSGIGLFELILCIVLRGSKGVCILVIYCV